MKSSAWCMAAILLGVTASVAQAQSYGNAIPAREGNVWTLGTAAEDRLSIKVEFSQGPAFRVSHFPGFSAPVFLRAKGAHYEVYDTTAKAWREFLRFTGPKSETYKVDVPSFLGGLTEVRVERGVKVVNAYLGVTHVNCVRFSFTTGLADAGVAAITIAPKTGFVRVEYANFVPQELAAENTLTLRTGVVDENPIGKLQVRSLDRGFATTMPTFPGVVKSSRVYRTPQSFAAFFKKLHPLRPVPEIDFSRESVIVVVAKRPSTGREVRVESAVRAGPAAFTQLRVTEILPTGFQSQVPMYYYDIVAVEGVAKTTTTTWQSIQPQ